MKAKLIGGVAVGALAAAAVGVGALKGPTRVESCELQLPDGGVVSVSVTVPAKSNALAACVDEAVAEKKRRSK